MFDDACYYVSEGVGDRRQNLIVKGMDFAEFAEEFRRRTGRLPFIVNMVSIDEEEFDIIDEMLGSNDYVYIGNGENQRHMQHRKTQTYSHHTNLIQYYRYSWC